MVGSIDESFTLRLEANVDELDVQCTELSLIVKVATRQGSKLGQRTLLAHVPDVRYICVSNHAALDTMFWIDRPEAVQLFCWSHSRVNVRNMAASLDRLHLSCRDRSTMRVQGVLHLQSFNAVCTDHSELALVGECVTPSARLNVDQAKVNWHVNGKIDSIVMSAWNNSVVSVKGHCTYDSALIEIDNQSHINPTNVSGYSMTVRNLCLRLERQSSIGGIRTTRSLTLNCRHEVRASVHHASACEIAYEEQDKSKTSCVILIPCDDDEEFTTTTVDSLEQSVPGTDCVAATPRIAAVKPPHMPVTPMVVEEPVVKPTKPSSAPRFECVVCMDTAPNMLVDCPHVCVCEECVATQRVCPLCKQPWISAPRKVYIA